VTETIRFSPTGPAGKPEARNLSIRRVIPKVQIESAALDLEKVESDSMRRSILESALDAGAQIPGDHSLVASQIEVTRADGDDFDSMLAAGLVMEHERADWQRPGRLVAGWAAGHIVLSAQGCIYPEAEEADEKLPSFSFLPSGDQRLEAKGWHRHKNPDGSKGGWVGPGAFVAPTATLGEKAWVHDSARVMDQAQVLGTSRVRDHALIIDRARLFGGSVVSDNAVISEDAYISGARVFGRAWISEDAVVTGAGVSGDAFVGRQAAIYSTAAILGEGAVILDRRHFWTCGPIGSEGRTVTVYRTDGGVVIVAGCWLGTPDEMEERIRSPKKKAWPKGSKKQRKLWQSDYRMVIERARQLSAEWHGGDAA